MRVVYTVFTYEGVYTVYTVFMYEGVRVYTVFTIVFTVFTYEGVYTVFTYDGIWANLSCAHYFAHVGFEQMGFAPSCPTRENHRLYFTNFTQYSFVNIFHITSN